MRADLPTGTVTFLFTDVEGSTRLLHALGADGYAAALEEHRRVLRQAFAAHGGVEVDTQGDAFFVAFPTAPGAAAAAARAHGSLAATAIRVRIGLHTGTPTPTTEGYVGVDVHRAARIGALAHGGQTLVSDATAALLGDGALLTDLGRHRLKDFDAPVRLLQLGEGVFPPLRTPGAVDLPNPATRFLGRERELYQAVSVVFEREPRILTILGPGGTGKTRFAIELGRMLADEAEGGTVFVPLAPIREPALMLPAVAERLGAPSADVSAIASRVAEKRTHLVLDNLEHLLPAAATAIASLAEAAPQLRLLVTSREALRIQGEEELDLPPMVGGDAVELFLARARAVRPGIEPTPEVEELCRRLDRLPLALELAAARTKLLTPAQLLQRLGGRLDLLAGTRDADARHATLRATIAWSYDLLDAAERELFARLSVFAAGCTLESAEQVCDADLDTLQSLLDKSLLRRRTGALGEERFWILETIREFAAERLEAAGGAGATRRRHAERMLDIARSAHLSAETGIGSAPQRHDLVLAERADVRAALDWGAEHEVELGLEVVLVLENFWAAHSPEEGGRRLDQLVDRAGPLSAETRARVLRVQGNHETSIGDLELGGRRYEESLATYRAIGDERGVVVVLSRLAANALRRGEAIRGRALLEQGLSLARAQQMPWVESQAVAMLGGIYRTEGDLEQAWQLAQSSVDIAAGCGFVWWQALGLTELLELGLELGRLDEAEEAGRESLRLSVAMENRRVTLWVLTGLARIELERGNLERAGRLWGTVAEEHAQDSVAPELIEFADRLPAMSDPRFVSASEEGRLAGLSAVVAESLAPEQRAM